MVRTQIYLDETQKSLLDRLSTERHTTVSDLVRDAIDEFIGGDPTLFQEGLKQSFGIWKDRNDFGRPDEFVRRLRRQWQKRQSGA